MQHMCCSTDAPTPHATRQRGGIDLEEALHRPPESGIAGQLWRSDRRRSSKRAERVKVKRPDGSTTRQRQDLEELAERSVRSRAELRTGGDGTLLHSSPCVLERRTTGPLERELRPKRQSGEAVLRHGAMVRHPTRCRFPSREDVGQSEHRAMTLTYWWDAPAGRLSIRCFNKGRWRLWAGDSYLGSFDTPDEAVRPLSDRTLTWPTGLRRLE